VTVCWKKYCITPTIKTTTKNHISLQVTSPYSVRSWVPETTLSMSQLYGAIIIVKTLSPQSESKLTPHDLIFFITLFE